MSGEATSDLRDSEKYLMKYLMSGTLLEHSLIKATGENNTEKVVTFKNVDLRVWRRCESGDRGGFQEGLVDFS